MKKASTFRVLTHSPENDPCKIIYKNGTTIQWYHMTYNGQAPSSDNPSLTIIGYNNERPIELDHPFLKLEHFQAHGEQMQAYFASCKSQNETNTFMSYLYEKLQVYIDMLLENDSYDTRQEWLFFRKQVLHLMHMPQVLFDESIRPHLFDIDMDYLPFYKNAYSKIITAMRSSALLLNDMPLVDQFIYIFLCHIQFIKAFLKKFIKDRWGNTFMGIDYTDHDQLFNQ
jgi:hypothetical protein